MWTKECLKNNLGHYLCMNTYCQRAQLLYGLNFNVPNHLIKMRCCIL